MDLKEFKRLLKDYCYMTEKLRSLKQEIENVKEEALAVIGACSLWFDGMPRGSGLSDTTYQKAEKIMTHYNDRISKLLHEVNTIILKQQHLTDLMRDLSRDEYNIIRARYLDGIGWDYIPAVVHMSRRTCFRTHNKAMSRILQKVKGE